MSKPQTTFTNTLPPHINALRTPFKTHLHTCAEISNSLRSSSTHTLTVSLQLFLCPLAMLCWDHPVCAEPSLHKPELCLSLSSSPLSQLGWLSVSFYSTSLMWIRVIDRLCVCACLCVYRKEETSRSPARRGPGRPRKRKSTSAPPFPTDSPKKVKWVFPFVLVLLYLQFLRVFEGRIPETQYKWLAETFLDRRKVHDFIVIKCNDISNYSVVFLRS